MKFLATPLIKPRPHWQQVEAAGNLSQKDKMRNIYSAINS